MKYLVVRAVDSVYHIVRHKAIKQYERAPHNKYIHMCSWQMVDDDDDRNQNHILVYSYILPASIIFR